MVKGLNGQLALRCIISIPPCIPKASLASTAARASTGLLSLPRSLALWSKKWNNSLTSTRISCAPRRHGRRKRYLHGRTGTSSSGELSNRREEHLAVALCNASRDGAVFALPDGRPLAIIDYQMPLKARQDDRGVGKVDLFAVLDGNLPCVIELKRSRRDTPLRALLEGLTYCAIVEANADDIASEVAGQHALSASRPTLIVMAPEDYWAGYLSHGSAGRWLPAIRDLVSGLRETLGLEICLVALLDARFEMGLLGRPARFVGSCRMASVDERLISQGRC